MKFFTKHLEETEETYFQHMNFALSFAGHMFIGAIACTIHAIAPFLFESTGSRRIGYLYERMILMRTQLKNQPKNKLHKLQNGGTEQVSLTGTDC